MKEALFWSCTSYVLVPTIGVNYFFSSDLKFCIYKLWIWNTNSEEDKLGGIPLAFLYLICIQHSHSIFVGCVKTACHQEMYINQEPDPPIWYLFSLSLPWWLSRHPSGNYLLVPSEWTITPFIILMQPIISICLCTSLTHLRSTTVYLCKDKMLWFCWWLTLFLKARITILSWNLDLVGGWPYF